MKTESRKLQQQIQLMCFESIQQNLEKLIYVSECRYIYRERDIPGKVDQMRRKEKKMSSYIYSSGNNLSQVKKWISAQSSSKLAITHQCCVLFWEVTFLYIWEPT